MSGKKLLAAVAALVVVIAVAAYFIIVPGQEKEYAEQIRIYLESMPGNPKVGSIEVNFLGKKAEAKNLTSDYVDGMGMRHEMSLDTLTIAGANLDMNNSQGVIPIMDSMQGKNFVLKSTGKDYTGQDISTEVSVDSFEFTNIRGDVAGLQALTASGSIASDPNAFFKVLSTFSAGSGSATNYVVKANTMGGPMMARVGSMSGKDMSMLTVRDGSWKDWNISMMNMEICTIESMNVAKMSIPAFDMGMIQEMERSGADGAEALQAMFSKGPIIVEGMEITNLNINPLKSEPVVMKKMTMDWHFALDRITIKAKIDNFMVPVSIYRMAGPELAYFASDYGKPLDISSAVDVNITQNNGSGDISLKDFMLQDAGLGVATGQAELAYRTEDNSFQTLMDDGADEVLLKSASGSIKDTGIVDVILKASMGPRANGQDVRGMAAAGAEMQASQTSDPDEKMLMEGVAKLLKQPGTLTVKAAPAQPVNVQSLGVNGAASLNLTVDYTPN